MYTALILAAVFLLGVSAQEPQRCNTPPAWEAKMFEIDTSRTFDVFANITYDAVNERLRIDESIDKRGSQTRDLEDNFFFFKEGIVYNVNLNTKVCVKKEIPDNIKFHPIGIPPDATFRGEAVIGSNAGSGIGLTVSLWTGTSPRGGRYFGTWTEPGCIPVQETHSLENRDVVRQSFYDVTVGYDPNRFIPPAGCQ